jgi:hypothetical protein
MRFNAFGARLAGLVVLAVVLPGCDDEPAQRKAFIEFLQTRIINKPGLHVPKPTDEDAKKFGPYARDYAIITGFNSDMDKSVAGPMQKAIQNGSIHSLAEVQSRRADIIAVRDGMAALRTALDQKLAAADTARAALRQPDDLKPVYDETYRRDVTVPAKAFADIFPDLDGALNAIIALGDFLDQHKAEVTINGPLIQTNNRALQTRLQAMLDDLNVKAEAVVKAQQKLQAITTGG